MDENNLPLRSPRRLRNQLPEAQNMAGALSSHLEAPFKFGSAKADEGLNLYKLATEVSEDVESSITFVNDASDLAKYDQGSALHLNPDIINLEQFGRDILNEVPLTKNGVKIVLDLCKNNTGDEGPGMAVTDPHVLRRALRHLLNNAIDVTVSGTITLGIGYRNKRLTITVADMGPGLEMAPGSTEGDLPTIFQPYYQGVLPNQPFDLTMETDLHDEIRTSSRKKTCLRLTYHLVQSFGGELRCTANNSEGTTFQFSLPRNVSFNCAIPQDFPLVSTSVVRTVRRARIFPQDI